METYDCDPSMTDTQVMEFCKQGFLVLEGIVPREIDLKTLAFLDAFYATQPTDLPERTATIPTDLFSENWFRDNVMLHPQVTGVLRSLLGKDFTLPDFLSNHRIKCPMSIFSSRRCCGLAKATIHQVADDPFFSPRLLRFGKSYSASSAQCDFFLPEAAKVWEKLQCVKCPMRLFFANVCMNWEQQ